ncbi:MAG: SLC13 family permease [Planctomycetaceae bacterium]
MGWEAWFTLITTLMVFIALVRDWATPDVVFVFAAAVLSVAGIISPAEVTKGFANPGMLTVAGMFIISAALRETGLLDFIGQRVLGSVRSQRRAIARLSFLIVPLSGFLNNTPIVAMMMPIVIEWCRRRNISPSKLLIPISYMAILGGTCTLIGTSTNLLIDGKIRDEYALLQEQQPDQINSDTQSSDSQPAPESIAAKRFREGLKPLGLFEISVIGIPYALIGMGYLLLLGTRLLPERKELLEQLGDSRREYLVEMMVQPECRLIGQSVEQANLRHLPGLFLIEIDREGRIIAPVSPEEMLVAGDRLVFTGVVSSIVELERIGGLLPAADPEYQVSPGQQRRRQLVEAVVSETSPLVGKTIREADFRATYNAAVLAVHRNAARLTNKVGDIELRPGDTLLMQTRPHFIRANRNSTDFYLVSSVEDWRPLRSDRAWIALSLFAILLILMTTGLVDTAVAALLIASAVVVTGCLSSGDARRSVEWQVLITIAASFAVGDALRNSGAAAAVAQTLVKATESFGPVAALICFYLIASILTEMVSNNAVASLMFPLCLETARLLEVSPRPFLIALMFAASASFATPIGYQTNMMVYGPGGYRFSDFLRVGLPLNTLLWLTATILIPMLFPFSG